MVLRLDAPPERRAEMIQALRVMAGPLGACRDLERCELLSSTEQPERLVIVEHWRSVRALEQRIRSDEFRQILALMEMSTLEPELEILRPTEPRALDYVARLRGVAPDQQP